MLFKKSGPVKWISMVLAACLTISHPLYAQGPPRSSGFDNPLRVAMIILMLVLLLVIALLANLLLGVAQVKSEKEKNTSVKNIIPLLLAALLLPAAGFSQENNPLENATAAVTQVGGMSAFSFYLMLSVVVVELLVTLVLLWNVRLLLKVDKPRPERVPVQQKLTVNIKRWWAKMNSFRPAEQEADIDLGHDYDGIRELDNRLPPWWLYGFYLTILTAGIYLYRFHVSHSAPSAAEEYSIAVAKADREVKEYLMKKGEQVDENSVTMLTEAADLEAGKAIFSKSCVACHNEGGAGNVGPNLTDDYWLHGGDIKSIFKTIRYGINAMPQWQNSFSNKQIAEISSYVKSLRGTHPANPKGPQGTLFTDESETAKPHVDSVVTKDVSSSK